MRLLIIALFIINNLYFQSILAEDKNKNTRIQKELIDQVVDMDINNIDLPVRNDGTTGNRAFAYYPNGQTTQSFLFEGGIATSAYVNGELRISWTYWYDWQPGVWGMNATDPLAKIYEVNSSDGFGSQAYIEWANAVNLGANFQDLNSDGVYDPQVDKPDILGDRTIWFVINDGTTLAQRLPSFATMTIGLECQVTAWAFENSSILNDVIFFRYRIINATDTTKDNLIFSIWEDNDIGDANDDLMGCDTSLNLGYAYNNGSDPIYGANPPAFGIHLLQGALVGSYGDTAFIYRGPFFGIDTVYNKRDLPMTSFMWNQRAHNVVGNPDTTSMARYYQLGGLDGFGNLLDPTAWGTGGTSGTNPLFVFSGDPVTQNGWLDTNSGGWDNRFLVNCGPFQLVNNDTQEIIIAYEVSQGYDAINSVEKLKYTSKITERFFKSNLLDNIDNETMNIVEKFSLKQNYPNPFNPVTQIEFSIPTAEFVTLEIYNLLGQKVATLVSENLKPGRYTYTWDTSENEFASGLYIYRLQAGNTFIQNKKMLLIR